MGAAASRTIVSSQYLATQLLLARATWGAFVPSPRGATMVSFFAYMLPSELSHALLALDVAVLVALYRSRHDPQGVAASPIGRVAAVLNVLLAIAHVALLVQNVRSRGAFASAFAKAGVALAVTPLSIGLLARALLVRPHPIHSPVQRHQRIPLLDPPSGGKVRRRRLQEMDVLALPTVARDAPYLMYVHGGGWVTGDKEYAALPLLYRVAAAGWVVVSVNYRLAPRVALRTQVADVKAAIHAIRTRVSKQVGGDPSVLVVAGESAGGHLAVLTALTQGRPEYNGNLPPDADTNVTACVDFCGVHDLLDRQGHFAERDKGFFKRFVSRVVLRKPADDPIALRYSPLELVDEALRSFPSQGDNDPLALPPTPAPPPPILGISGTVDNLVPPKQTIHFYERLRLLRRAHGQPENTDIHVHINGAHHAFHYVPSFRTDAAADAVIAFAEHHRRRARAKL